MEQARVRLERLATVRSSSASKNRRLHATVQLLGTLGFAYLAALIDAVAIIGAALASGSIYGLFATGPAPYPQSAASVGAVVWVLVALATMQKGAYGFRFYLSASGQVSRAFPNWALAILAALALGFATKTTADFPRGAIGVFSLLGFATIVLARRGLVDVLTILRNKGLAAPRRVVAVGFEHCLANLITRSDLNEEGVDVVSIFALRDNQAYLADDLALAAAAVRMQRPDDVCIAIPWSRPEVIEASLDAFLKLPAEVHLAADSFLDRFGESKVIRLGAISGLTITHRPLSVLEQLEKRLFDFTFATAALIALAPLFVAVAICIRWDSKGPALFRQTRYGFNQEPFRIFKFRTMKTMEDGASVVQATRGDARVTGIGAYLRRFSIDELPQLLNVLRGEMSIVGPRPHAMAHDQRYVERLARYARRHNVKPGITGWAQVCGHRGEIEDDSRMQARLEHDLYYIDNWSIWLDMKIIMLTIFSRRAHLGAY